MGRFASDTGGGDFKQMPAANHVARSFQLIDIGTHESEYLGVKKRQNQIILRWETPFEMEEIDGVLKPLTISAFLTNSLNEKAKLRKWLASWRSRDFTVEELRRFDLNTVLNKPCTLSVIHNDKGKAVVAGVAALPKGTDCPKAYNPISSFWIDEWDDAAFDKLPKGFQQMIRESDEYKAMGRKKDDDLETAPSKTFAPDDDEIPF